MQARSRVADLRTFARGLSSADGFGFGLCLLWRCEHASPLCAG